jgi:O-antigen ligase
MRQRSRFADAMRVVLPFGVITLGVFAIKPGLLRLVFPAATCVFGYSLYRKNESYFLSFVLWIYMLAPLLRRLVDWRTYYQEQSYILLAPLLVTLIPAIDIRSRLVSVSPIVRSVAMLALAGICYGFGVGLLKHPGADVFLACGTWTAPITLCIFAASLRERKDLDRVLSRTLLWGVALMAAYGIYQFAVAPPWDTYWLVNISKGAASLDPSFGQPRPFAIRVWSTMNAPGPFATSLGVALIWLAIRKDVSSLVVMGFGYLALLLTLGRSAWLQVVLGLLVILFGCRPRPPLKGLLTLLAVLALLGLSLAQVPQFADIQQRFQSFSHLGRDDSANERRDMYKYMADMLLASPAGHGLDTTTNVHGYPLDSSLVTVFYMLGWIGASCYLSSFVLTIGEIVRGIPNISHEKVAAAAIVLSSMTQIMSGDVLFRQGGLFLWLFVGVWFSLRAQTQYVHESAVCRAAD